MSSRVETRKPAAAVLPSAAVSGPRPVLSLLGLTAALFKVRVSGLITYTALVGGLVAAGGEMLLADLGWLALSSGLSCAGAGCLNHYFDREIDAAMERTLRRPLPAGRIAHPRAVPAAAVLLVASGLLAAAHYLNLSVALWGLLGVLVYVVVYTVWLKRRTAWNIVIGGAAGSAAVLAGGAAGSPAGQVPAVMALAAVVFLWTPVHFWSLAIAYEHDYRKAGIPMLPVVVGAGRTGWAILASAMALVGTTLVPAFLGWLGWPFLVAALAGGCMMIVASARLMRRPDRREALVTFGVSNLYLLVLFFAAMLSLWI